MSLEGDPSFIMKFHDIVLENLNMNNAKSVFEKSIVNYVKKYGQITENSINQIEGSLIDIEKSFACDDKEEFTDDSVKAEKPNSNEIIQKARLSSVVDSLITAMHMDHNNKTALENTVVSAMYSLSNMGSNILDIKEHEYATGVFVIDDKKTVKVQNVFDERNYNIKEALKPMVAVQNMLMESVTSETPVNKDKVKSLFNNSISYFVGKGKILGEI
jgi:hypothetical protein